MKRQLVIAMIVIGGALTTLQAVMLGVYLHSQDALAVETQEQANRTAEETNAELQAQYDKAVELRASAAYGLCVQGDVRGLLPLMAARADGAGAALKYHAIGQLVRKAPQETAALLSPDGADADVRRRVAGLLPRVHRQGEPPLPDEVVRALRRAACTDPDPAVREAALRALQRVGWPAWD